MAHSTEKQAGIDRKKTSAAAGYPYLWRRMLSEWQCPEASDRAWLLYSANYLLRTAGVRWALDPLTLRQRLPIAPGVDVSALAALDYIVLTHRHADHLDVGLLRCLREFPIHWIVPDALLEPVQELNLPPQNITVPHPLEPLHLGNLTLTPFDGLHWEADSSHPDGLRGIPSTGYLAEFNGKRWLFPGDIRTYDASRLPSFDSVDGIFAHLWLGRRSALMTSPPLLDHFCRFYIDLQPKRIVITHMEDFGRDVNDFWDNWHYQMVFANFQKISSYIQISSAKIGESVVL